MLTFTPTKLPVNYHLHVLYAKHLSILSQLISTHILIDMTSLLTSNTVLEVEDHARLSIIGTINDFVETLNHLGQIDAIFLDMSKAFDTVPLKRLSCELSHYGIRGYTLKWIENLLTGRSQQVVVNGEYSDPTTVISGVPQGSVFGPLLFLCYINNITQNLTSIKFDYYADRGVGRGVPGGSGTPL